jgi:hypothetical protein
VETFLDFGAAAAYVVKPTRSAGTDGVFKVNSLASARTAFDALLGHPNALGATNAAVVVQEFVSGAEYIVDTVSRAGKHKVVALWRYDKRSIVREGVVHDFIYFGQSDVSGDSKTGKALASYALKVLDALGVREGAAHAEIIMAPSRNKGHFNFSRSLSRMRSRARGLIIRSSNRADDEEKRADHSDVDADGEPLSPCLVEVGCRPQGNEGTFAPVASMVWGEGRDQVSALVAAATGDGTAFDALPDVCGAGRVHSFKVDFVSEVAGILRAIDSAALAAMRALPSFLRFDLLPRVGERIERTETCFTAVGSVSLVHADKKQLDEDVKQVRRLEHMWIVDEEDPKEQDSSVKD